MVYSTPNFGLSSQPVLEQLKAGDVEAQARLWRTSRRTVCAICTHILGAGPAAEDLADEVMTDFLFKYVGRLSREESIESYLRLMAVRRALRARALGARLRGSDAKEQNEALPYDAVPADDAIGWAQLLPRLERCLGKLTPKARQVIRLRFQGDLTNENIGSIVGGSKQYIGRLLKQSLSVLRECLERP